MNHTDAVSQFAVEKYLLGELGPEERDAFEEHYFGCEECTADLRAATLFLAQAKQELARPSAIPSSVATVEPKRNLFSFPSLLRPQSLLRPTFVAPVFAAMLLFIGFQNTVTFPRLKNMAAVASQPQVLPSVNLVDGGSRSGEMRTVDVKPHQPFLLSVDVPAQIPFSAYLCSLYSPSGKPLWQITVPSSQVSDTVSIQVPPDNTQAGVNTLLIQGIPTDAQNKTPVDLVRYRFLLQIR